MKLPSYDDLNRPSCGPGSAFYGAGAEVAWTDQQNRPSAGVGSAMYLAGAPTTWVFDHHGVPSCGPGSKLYGSEPAAAAVVLKLNSTTQQNDNYVPVTVTGARITRAYTVAGGALPVAFNLTGTAAVHSVVAHWTVKDPFGSPSSLVQPEMTLLSAQIGAGITWFHVPLPRLPMGMYAELTLTWEQLVPATSAVDVTANMPAVAGVVGPNGGVYPVYDSAGRPSVGPGSAHYKDVVLVLDGLSRPSCGPGSANYLDGALAAPDSLGRPSCGAGSGSYKAHSAVTGPFGPNTAGYVIESPLIYPYGQATANLPVAFDVPLNACQIGGTQVRALAITQDITIRSAMYSFTYTKQDGTTATTAPAALPTAYDFGLTGDPTLFANNFYGGGTGEWRSTIPPLPADVEPYSQIVVHVTALLSGAGSTGGDFVSFYQMALIATDCPAYPGPNGGVDRPCAVGPNNGVDVSCSGPNGGVDAPLAGVEPVCDVSSPGPNSGTDRALVTQCVTLLSLCPQKFTGGWPSAWSTADLPHPGDSASVLPALCIVSQDRLQGRASPTGRVPWTLGFYGSGLAAPCGGTHILSVRIKAKLRTPTGTGASWTLLAVDPASSTVYGGFQSVTTSHEAVEGTEVTFACDIDSIDQLVRLVVIGDLGAPPGGSEGWIDTLRLEVQYIGGPGCLDCGPNHGIAVSCDDDPHADPELVDPDIMCASYVTPPGTETVPVIKIRVGTVPLEGMLIRFTPNPDGLECAGSNDRWTAVAPCAQWWIPNLPAGTVLRIDGMLERVVVESGPDIATGLLVYGDLSHNPPTWPSFAGTVCVCASVGPHDGARFTLDVDMVQRSLNGGV